ncbi:hypothetical protein BRADI_3g33713v3 [Brachypodium distachyon]|uniref:Uncharacterized protein n=1 Tax=Brachypodium distachyon TaxID=15368 RepID=A0A2K2D0V7_BRADI|nr:hypothetical protein BRADI_3g33713v3 [Brachypodium distachyon]
MQPVPNAPEVDKTCIDNKKAPPITQLHDQRCYISAFTQCLMTSRNHT